MEIRNGNRAKPFVPSGRPNGARRWVVIGYFNSLWQFAFSGSQFGQYPTVAIFKSMAGEGPRAGIQPRNSPAIYVQQKRPNTKNSQMPVILDSLKPIVLNGPLIYFRSSGPMDKTS